MTRKYFLPALLIYSLQLSAQNVGIGTKSPAATLHIVGKGATSATRTFLVKSCALSSTAFPLINAYDNGNIALSNNPAAPYTGAPDSQFVIYGYNNGGNGTTASFKDSFYNSYITSPAPAWMGFRIYINGTPADQNPAAIASWNWITDNDGNKSNYTNSVKVGTYTATLNGAFYGNNRSALDRASGFYLYENGTVWISTYLGGGGTSSVATEGSLKVLDQNLGYAAGQTCTNPGTIVISNNVFLGCAENFAADNVTVTSITWKQLNN